MNTEPKKNAPIIDPELSQALKQTPSRFWKRLTHNWGWKLLSLLLAVCLWAGLITQDPNLTRERRFTNVPITITGQETMLNNGLIVLSGLEQDKLVLEAFRAQIPQRSFDNATYTNFSPRIDLSRINKTGEQDVRVLFTTSTTYGTVEAASPDTFHIVVDDYITNYRIPVTLNTVGEAPAGFYAPSPIIEPGTIAVSGPKTLVDRVACVQADYDLGKFNARAGIFRQVLPLKYLDIDGNVIESDLLTASSASTTLRTITVEQRLYASKELDVSLNAILTGTPAKGYEVKSVTAVPSSLLAAGDATVLKTIDTIFTDAPLSVDDVSESFAQEIRLRKPSELSYLSATAATVYVEIGPVISSKDFSELKIAIEGLSGDLRGTLDRNTTTVTLTGPQLSLDVLRSKNITLSVNAEGLQEGEHTLPVRISLKDAEVDNFQFQLLNPTVTLTLTAK